MNVHLIKSGELKDETYQDLLHVLQQVPGFLNFVAQTDKHEEIIRDADPRMRSSWDELFNACRSYRTTYDIGSEEHVVLLTDQSNEMNWFSAGDPHANNHFVHTAGWEVLLGNEIDVRFPIAYEVTVSILHKMMFDNYQQVIDTVHHEPRGCIMDLCRDKTEVSLKMRTTDICHDCLELIKNRSIPKQLVKHVLEIFDSIRKNLTFRERFAYLNEPSRLEVRGYTKRIFLTDLGDLEIRLNPKERALFVLFLNHPDGIHLNDLDQHKEELISLYERTTNMYAQEEIEEAINRFIDISDNNVSEVLSRIRRKFRQAVGEEMAKHYVIDGERGEKKSIILSERQIIHTEDVR